MSTLGRAGRNRPGNFGQGNQKECVRVSHSLAKHSSADLSIDLIPGAPMEINLKCRIHGLEKTSDCFAEEELPGQAASNRIKVNQTNVDKG